MSNTESKPNGVRDSRRSLLKMAASLGADTALRGLGTLGMALSASGTANAQAGKVVNIGYQKYGNFIVLKARGTLEKRLAPLGFSVRWLEFPAGPQLLEGVNANAVDIGVVGETPPVFAQAGGVDFVYIAAEPDAPRGEALIVPKDSPIRSLSELRGKKIAVTKGSNANYLLVKALEHGKVGYNEIQTAYLVPADARAAFANGSVDAWSIWDPYLAAAERQLGARVLTNGEGLVRNVEYYVARRSFATAHADAVHAVLAELQQLDSWAEHNVAAVATQLAPLTGLDTGTLELALGRTGYGVLPVDAGTFAYQQQIADTLYDIKLIPKKLVVTDARWQNA
ncbi:ABC transporter, substrate-binding protein, aliphatic sulfonates family [Burkholderia sp. Ch1-1]|uniref:Putative aliphatic sulfonates-binding protein n=1 Tax=Paraburkholderia dioscoreae TaxID=2604047 RepID=A0A5Q4YV12_9BURK|nr:MULTISPECIES: sulfonate ABC transporter substrate-binding protein [Paraburkholderia]EIF31809.1 ABC transporter, substrate-binding protein, aliphatic sulfonates family [Burkholderia sp. Ch1-1]MDR8397874.1 sulfonate ABC transporter substrate-binding protein [Paraburkholderia sp. USG1]VVD27902.1 ABC transporter, substrate-binding protein, aliphatic sulfonates family [Paraburkholderia dioscoreae]